MAKLGKTTVENVEFRVYLMNIELAAPPLKVISYTIRQGPIKTNIDSFTLTADPNPTSYWDDPQWEYELYLSDETTKVDPNYFV